MSQELAGHCVLVVEDEFFFASEIENALTRAGSDVIGPIPDALSAMNQVLADGFDLAVLDINLGGDLVFPIADALVEQGVPFLFASAYPGSGIPAPHKERPVIAHPNHACELISGLLDLLVNVGKCIKARLVRISGMCRTWRQWVESTRAGIGPLSRLQ
jgi:CheY-like chemotaxis protein